MQAHVGHRPQHGHREREVERQRRPHRPVARGEDVDEVAQADEGPGAAFVVEQRHRRADTEGHEHQHRHRRYSGSEVRVGPGALAQLGHAAARAPATIQIVGEQEREDSEADRVGRVRGGRRRGAQRLEHRRLGLGERGLRIGGAAQHPPERPLRRLPDRAHLEPVRHRHRVGKLQAERLQDRVLADCRIVPRRARRHGLVPLGRADESARRSCEPARERQSRLGLARARREQQRPRWSPAAWRAGRSS